MAPFFRRLQGDGPFDALRTLTLYRFEDRAIRWRRREDVGSGVVKGWWWPGQSPPEESGGGAL